MMGVGLGVGLGLSGACVDSTLSVRATGAAAGAHERDTRCFTTPAPEDAGMLPC